MNVVYDLLGFQSRDHGERGIARYVLNLGLALERTNPGLVTEYLVHPDLPFPAGAEPLLATGRLQLAGRKDTGRRSSAGGVFIAGSPFECFNQPSDLILPRSARTSEWRRMVVLHDLIPAIFPELYLDYEPNRRWYGARLASLSMFDRFLANSQATADDALAMLDLAPRDVTVIGAGADDQFRPPEDGPRAAAASLVSSGLVPGLRPGYVLFPTGIDPRKNIERTIHAYGRLPRSLRSRHQLVLACRLSDGDRRTVMAMADEAGLTEELLVTGYVSDQVLCRLYQGSHLVVFPSYYEGFGLPALEAMKCGAPVICADATSLVEVQPLVEARFDPLSVRAIAGAMQRALDDEELRSVLRNQTPPPFTWDNAGRRTADAVRAALDELDTRIKIDIRTDPSSPPKPRLALFAPLPPQQTGVANYAYRLVEELRHLCEVTVFVDCGPGDRDRPGVIDEDRIEPSELLRPDDVTVVSQDRYQAMAAGGGAFDQTLYMLGNSRHHLQTLQANKVDKSHVLLHEVRLTELYRSIRNDLPERLVEHSVGRTLAAYYPERYRPEVEAMDEITAETAHRFGILMARGIAEDTTELLVHSQCAKTWLRLDGAGEATVAFPMPCPTFEVPAEPGPGQPLVTAFGPLDASRQPERLVMAMAEVVKLLPDSRLRFIGRFTSENRDRLVDLARRYGLADSIDFMADLTDADFRRRQRETWLAVQLRSRTDGGSSNTLSELIGLGVPTVVSDLDAAGELPGDVVLKVADTMDSTGLGRLIAETLEDDNRRRALSLAARDHASKYNFKLAAETIAHLLFQSPEERKTSDLTGGGSRLVRGQRKTVEDLDVIHGGLSAYLGENLLVTRLYNGQDIYVDGRDTSLAPALLLDGHWEPETTAIFTNLLTPSSCVIDVGANFGYFGLVAGAVVDARNGGAIHMIEANPALVGLIERSIAVNKMMGTAEAWNYAVSDRPGQLQLQVPQHLWGSSNLEGFDLDLEEAIDRSLRRRLAIEQLIDVVAIDLDSFVDEQGIERVDLIKIDIEGHEERAYRGMGRLIEQNRGHLRMLIEFSTGQYEDPVGFFDQIRQDFGSVSLIHPRHGRLIPVANHADVMALSRSGFVMLLAGGADIAVQEGLQLQRSGNV